MKVDLEKLEVAMKYMDRIADGRNPVNNIPIDEDSVLNNPNVIRCMYFIKEILSAVKENNGIIESRAAKAVKIPFPFECLTEFQYEEDKSITHFLNQIKSLAGDPNVKGIAIKTITEWLKNMGYMDELKDENTGKTSSIATPSGIEFGLYMEDRTSMRGQEYQIVMYSKKAQEFLVANLEKIVAGEVLENEESLS